MIDDSITIFFENWLELLLLALLFCLHLCKCFKRLWLNNQKTTYMYIQHCVCRAMFVFKPNVEGFF